MTPRYTPLPTPPITVSRAPSTPGFLTPPLHIAPFRRIKSTSRDGLQRLPRAVISIWGWTTALGLPTATPVVDCGLGDIAAARARALCFPNYGQVATSRPNRQSSNWAFRQNLPHFDFLLPFVHPCFPLLILLAFFASTFAFAFYLSLLRS